VRGIFLGRFFLARFGGLWGVFSSPKANNGAYFDRLNTSFFLAGYRPQGRFLPPP